jgi:hypothetical protein
MRSTRSLASDAGRSLDSGEATGLVRRLPWSFVDCLSIASGALVDSLVLAIMKGPWAHPTLADIERLAGEVKASHLLYRSLGWLERPEFAALADRIVPPIHARRLWEHWERPPISWYPGGHVSFFWTPGVQRFVEEALYRSGFTQPTRMNRRP